MKKIIGFIGGGNMATSLIGGLLSTKNLGNIEPSIIVFEPNTDKAQDIQSQYPVEIARSNAELVERADVVVIAVKPQVLQSILEPLQSSFAESQPLIISVVAGIRVASINSWLDDAFAIVRVMPNTPALVGAGASGLYANDRVTDDQKSLAESLMSAVGVAAWVDHETDIDTVTALSGSGPAYFMLFIESLVDAAINAGLSKEVALTLATQTAAGAAQLIEQSDQPLSDLIVNVTSPGGTTEQALNAFRDADFSAITRSAFEAARRRSQELADELG